MRRLPSPPRGDPVQPHRAQPHRRGVSRHEKTTPTGSSILTRTIITIGALTLIAGAGAATLTTTTTRGAGTDQTAELAHARAQASALRAELARERRRDRVAVARATSPARSAKSSVDHALTIAAAAYGVPKAKLRRVANCESTLNPAATNGRYVGLFQFGTPLWSTTPYRRFSRTDPYAASLAAAWAFSRGMASHWPVCGRR